MVKCVYQEFLASRRLGLRPALIAVFVCFENYVSFPSFAG